MRSKALKGDLPGNCGSAARFEHVVSMIYTEPAAAGRPQIPDCGGRTHGGAQPPSPKAYCWKEQAMNRMHLQALRSSILGTLTLAVLIFVPAGTVWYWQGWVYVAVFVAASAAFTVYLALYDPELMRRRMRGGPSQEEEPAQRIIMRFLLLGFLLLIVVPALDHRFGWSRAAWPVAIGGDLLVALSFFSFYRVVRVNSFAASTIRVEEGQRVVSAGPYAWVRHPMYSGAFALLLGTPLALGSWRGLLIVPVFLPILAWRIINEEAVLARKLPGYAEYQQKVRWRLIPLVW
jgi:protein-S-isoprenylcysteine O-methyltransferase Ste14